jgi:hypothetical protein
LAWAADNLKGKLMGRETYRYRQLDTEREKRQRMNPLWRGAGCLLMVVFALGGYAFSGWFLTANAQNGWIYLPPQAMQPAFLPSWLPYGVLPRSVIGFLFLLLGFGLVSFVYAIMFPIKPGEADVPTPKRKRKRGTFRSRGR